MFQPVCVLTALSSVVLWTTAAVADPEPTAAEKLFVLKVRPLLQEKCAACHGQDPENIESGFDLTSRDGLLKGGDLFEATVLVPGHAEQSLLYDMVRRTDPDIAMPPKEAEQLTEQQTWWVRDWINGGAPWPADNRITEIFEKYAEGITWPTSGGLSTEWTRRRYKPADLWAWQPLWQDDDGRLNGIAAHDVIDALIDARLDQAGIEAAPPADRRTLIRRATFDLHGLPPRPEDVDAFLADPRPHDEAMAALVDRLLSSPHYGEQWARHWLDVVRYADSSGFANDYERPNAWRYRDYVIRAFNNDKPYDQFVREQIAGDELARRRRTNHNERTADPDDTASPEEPTDTELLIAAGFLRMGPWEHTGMSVAKITRQQFLDDVTDAVGQVFLGQALQCCRCHDHKFDPVPTQDYYAIQAVFATTQFADVDSEWLPEENRLGMEDDRRYHQMRQASNDRLLNELSRRRAEYEREWFEQQGLPYKTRQEAKEANAPKEHFPPNRLLKTPDEFGQERIGRKWRNRFSWELDRYQPVAFTVYNGPTLMPRASEGRIAMPKNPLKNGHLQETAILKGGDVFAPDQPVKPGVLSAVPTASSFDIPDTADGRRTALADWIISPENTLTARVMVNRIWQWHFGRGIAGNPNNFGATGQKPTHPELLDWLAGEFIRSGWSVRHMHRLILQSEVWQRSSDHPDSVRLAEQDPQHALYAVFLPRRLEAEELRDAMLAVSGELNPMAGGIPIRPDMNLEAALQPRMIMGTFAPGYVPNPKPEDRNRRSVYALKLRGHRDPMMEIFNQPGPDKSCEIRDTSTVSPQALTLLNGEEASDRALALAADVLRTAATDADAIRAVFQRAYGRPPDDVETSAALNHWQDMTAVQEGLVFQPRNYPTQVTRRANDENTGQVFTFTERLFVYEDYIHDLQPHEVDARTRALADLCLAVLNSNEFVFVY